MPSSTLPLSGQRLLMLGGADIQVAAIKFAKELGAYVITCDYLPGNPGHAFSDEYHNVSTTDFEGVLALAERLKVDGLLAYASDPAAPTVAYVGERLGLPSNTFSAVQTLSNKDEFRAFMTKNNFLTPQAQTASSLEEIENFYKKINGPCIIKPVDASGSKGISVVRSLAELKPSFEYGIANSRAKRLVIEEYIERSEPQICGDVFVLDGKIVFYCFGNVHFDTDCNSLVPCSITLPMKNSATIERDLVATVQAMFDQLGIKMGAFNVDALVRPDGRVFVVEIGARNGGNLLTELIYFHTGVNLAELVIRSALGAEIKPEQYTTKIQDRGAHAHYVIHSRRAGKLKEIHFTEKLEKRLLLKAVNVTRGQDVRKFNGSGDRLGVVLMKFDSMNEMWSEISSMMAGSVIVELESGERWP